jgi:hypothetical protein
MGSPDDRDAQFVGSVPTPEGSFGIKAMQFDLVDDMGMPVPHDAVHLHHVVLTDLRADPFCATRPLFFAGSGAERTPIELPDPYALIMPAGTSWGAVWDVMNTSAQPQTVWISYKVSFQPGANTTNSRNVVPYFLDVAGCGNAEFDVPGTGGAGSVFEKTWSWTAPASGIAVFAGGHVHPGAIDATLSIDHMKATCTATPHYMEMPMPMPMAMSGVALAGAAAALSTASMAMNPMIENIPPCALHHPVVQGLKYRVTARYDNSAPHPGVMGIFLVYVWSATPHHRDTGDTPDGDERHQREARDEGRRAGDGNVLDGHRGPGITRLRRGRRLRPHTRERRWRAGCDRARRGTRRDR